MADFNRNSNGVFGEIKLNGNGNDTESTSFFEGTMVSGINIPTADSQNNGTQNGVNETKRGVFGNFETVQTNENRNNGANNGMNFQSVEQNKALAKTGGIWSKIKSFLFKEIDLNAPVKVELTPYQQKVEDEINEFLHQEITWEKVHDFLFQEVKFGNNN